MPELDDLPELRLATNKNTQDIAALTLTVRELSGNVQLLIESQKSLSSLIESKVEHTIEIHYIKKTLADLTEGVLTLTKRIDKLEKLEFFGEGEEAGRHKFITRIKDYWILIFIMVSLATGSIYLHELSPVLLKDTASIVTKASEEEVHE